MKQNSFKDVVIVFFIVLVLCLFVGLVCSKLVGGWLDKPTPTPTYVITKELPTDEPTATPTKERTRVPTNTPTPLDPTATNTRVPPTKEPTATFTVGVEPEIPTATPWPYDLDGCYCHQDAICLCSDYDTGVSDTFVWFGKGKGNLKDKVELPLPAKWGKRPYCGKHKIRKGVYCIEHYPIETRPPIELPLPLE